VRDTVLAVIVIAVLFWSIASLKSLRRVGPAIGTPGTMSVESSPSAKKPIFATKAEALTKAKTRANAKPFTLKGDTHNERANFKLGKAKVRSKIPRSSGYASEIAKLTSIYAPEEPPSISKSDQSAISTGVENVTPSTTASENRSKSDGVETSLGESTPKIVAGVPIQAYVRYKQKSLAVSMVPIPRNTGLRVFLNCMEVKQKGLSYAGEKECETVLPKAIATRHPTIPTGSQPYF
jgi:hypothetical protein